MTTLTLKAPLKGANFTQNDLMEVVSVASENPERRKLSNFAPNTGSAREYQIDMMYDYGAYRMGVPNPDGETITKQHLLALADEGIRLHCGRIDSPSAPLIDKNVSQKLMDVVDAVIEQHQMAAATR